MSDKTRDIVFKEYPSSWFGLFRAYSDQGKEDSTEKGSVYFIDNAKGCKGKTKDGDVYFQDKANKCKGETKDGDVGFWDDVIGCEGITAKGNLYIYNDARGNRLYGVGNVHQFFDLNTGNHRNYFYGNASDQKLTSVDNQMFSASFNTEMHASDPSKSGYKKNNNKSDTLMFQYRVNHYGINADKQHKAALSAHGSKRSLIIAAGVSPLQKNHTKTSYKMIIKGTSDIKSQALIMPYLYIDKLGGRIKKRLNWYNFDLDLYEKYKKGMDHSHITIECGDGKEVIYLPSLPERTKNTVMVIKGFNPSKDALAFAKGEKDVITLPTNTVRDFSINYKGIDVQFKNMVVRNKGTLNQSKIKRLDRSAFIKTLYNLNIHDPIDKTSLWQCLGNNAGTAGNLRGK
jgi:hypothetical protein